MADAAQRITSRRRKREDEQAAAVEWLRAKRDEMGLTVLAKMLDVDVANLGKMIDGKRAPSKFLVVRIFSDRRN